MALPETISAVLASFALIGLAELGDKSQIVCMVLASRHSPWPVLLGATTAFVTLNALAVVFGAGIAAWVPEQAIAITVALLFGAFGINALTARDEDEPAEVEERPSRSVFLTTLSLVFVAELGDKTQLAVAGLASSLAPLAVWVGATAALVIVSAMGVWLGRTVLQRLPVRWLHKASGVVFLTFAAMAGWRGLAVA